MEEDEYRSAYHAINQQRCVFEKSVLSRRTVCQHAQRFCLADREGVACQDSQATEQCRTLLNKMRDKARFALKLTRIDGPLPHAKEVKVQTGGLLGMAQLLRSDESEQSQAVPDIHTLVQQAIARYGNLENLPYEAIARSIVQFEGRQRRKRD